tara:strand:- start:976 stop:1404 length:429 start_codon:yes stop_codon:yes gene_type:complete
MTVAETQLAELKSWLAASSADERSPMGDTIIHGPYAQLVACGLDDVPPDTTAAIASGALPLFVADDVSAAPLVAPEAQPLLSDRAAHVVWLAGAAIHDAMRGFPACAVVRLQPGMTMRQAAVAAGVDPDAERLIVGIPAACF